MKAAKINPLIIVLADPAWLWSDSLPQAMQREPRHLSYTDMNMRNLSRAVAACLMVAGGLVADARASLTIETVPVGNPDNVPDTRYNSIAIGGVSYPYQIGKFEVTAGQYCEFLNKVAATDTFGLYYEYMDTAVFSEGCNIKRSGSPGSYVYTVGTEWANRPVNYIDWGKAARFVNWLTNGQPAGIQDASTTEDGSYFLNGATTQAALQGVTRKSNAQWLIPTESEWSKAAYHKNNGASGDYWDYPTQTDSRPSNVLSDPDPGNNANFYAGGDTIGSPYYRSEVGAFAKSESAYGTFDQAGNVAEWTESAIVRGGSYEYFGSDLEAASRYLSNRGPDAGGNLVGFRIAYVPEPATAVLLVLSGAGLLLRRKPPLA